jgi:hypothetical protein
MECFRVIGVSKYGFLKRHYNRNNFKKEVCNASGSQAMQRMWIWSKI